MYSLLPLTASQIKWKQKLPSILDNAAPLKTGHRSGPRKSKNWLSPEANDAKKRRRRLERRWKASKSESDRKLYRSACSTANKLIKKSSAESNLECIKDASKNPKRLWSKIKSLLHSSPPVEQLSPSLSQPLANSLASFFCQKIVALKESISSKLHSGPSLLILINHMLLIYFQILLRSLLLKSLDSVSQCLINRLSSTTSQLLFWSHVLILSPSSSPILQTYPSPRQLFLPISNLHSSHSFWKNLVCQNLILPILGPFLISIQLAKSWSDLLLHDFSPMCRSLPISVLFSLLTASSTQLKLPYSNLWTTSAKT